ncbi:MAG: hypothetical protein ACRDVL_01645 [Acidimicrobiia bacterium]
MTRRDLLEHNDLSKTWVALEAAAPTVDWDDLKETLGIDAPVRRQPRLRRILAVAAIALMLVFLGTETVGVFAARRAIASGSAVSDESIRLQLSTVEVEKPASLLGAGAEASVDLGVTSTMVLASVRDISDPSADFGNRPGVTARLTVDGWERLDVDLDHIVESSVVPGGELILGFDWTGSDQPDRVYSVHMIHSGVDQPKPLHAFVDAPVGTSFWAIIGTDDGLVAASRTDNALRLWHSMDGETWESSDPFASGAVNSATIDGDQTVFVGYESGLISFEEFGVHAIWTQAGDQTPKAAEIAGLRSQGFGYVIGGFRLSNGLEDVVAFDGGLLAYTGYLQMWTGFAEGITLEPSESWSSLVVTSPDGATWEAHLLSDFGINHVIPFGDGLLAAAARAPDSDTRTVEGEDGTTYEVAVIPESNLYYSEDGLTWHPVENSPGFIKPLLLQTGDGSAIAIDEDADEDPTNAMTTIHFIAP